MRWTLLALAYMATLFLLSSIPDEDGQGRGLLFPPPAVQNLLHVPVYAGLAWLWWRALASSKPAAKTRAVLPAAGIAIAYGVLDEIHQMFVPGRFASVTDALLNAAGAAAVVVWVYGRTRNSGRSR